MSAKLDALVAEKVMGWRQVDPESIGWIKGQHVWITNEALGWLRRAFRPSQEIADAWQVVLAMRARNYAVRIEANRFPSGDLVSVWPNDGNTENVNGFGGMSGKLNEPETTPLHICIASLRAVGVDEATIEGAEP